MIANSPSLRIAPPMPIGIGLILRPIASWIRRIAHREAFLAGRIAIPKEPILAPAAGIFFIIANESDMGIYIAKAGSPECWIIAPGKSASIPAAPEIDETILIWNWYPDGSLSNHHLCRSVLRAIPGVDNYRRWIGSGFR